MLEVCAEFCLGTCVLNSAGESECLRRVLSSVWGPKCLRRVMSSVFGPECLRCAF